MKLAILGGGGFRVPLVYGALLRDHSERRVDAVTLYDIDTERLQAIGHVLAQMSASTSGPVPPPTVETTTDLDDAVRDADFVFSAIRVGGLAGRTADERVALDLGVLGQETTGPGGLAYGLRTVPVAVEVAERVRDLAPDAWVINFTNPAGLITEAMQTALGPRVIGICDSPIGLGRRAARALDLDPARTTFGYAGLNHLGWLRTLTHEGVDVLPRLLADPERLLRTEEGRLFGPEWLATIGAIPNEYLYYYYSTREALAAITGSGETRGEYLLRQQDGFYAEVAARPSDAYAVWQRVRHERDASYMKESRQAEEERDAVDVEGGGYEGVALAIMGAIARGERTAMLLNVRNGTTLAGLPADAVVEVPCTVDADGAHPLVVAPLAGHPMGLVLQVKTVERLVIEAATTRSATRAVEAFALHPLVDSVTVGRQLLAAYRDRIPEVDALFRRS